MKKYTYKNHQITVFKGFNGDEVFITKGNENIYSARVNKGGSQARVKAILG